MSSPNDGGGFGKKESAGCDGSDGVSVVRGFGDAVNDGRARAAPWSS